MEQTLKSTKYFITRFRLDQENYEFDREKLLASLNEYFLSIISIDRANSKGTKDGFNYKKFKNCIAQVENKFWAISNKKVGLPFTNDLWSAFFAIYIIPVRAELFPEVHQHIVENRANKEEQITKSITSSSLLGNYLMGYTHMKEVEVSKVVKANPSVRKTKESDTYYKFLDASSEVIITLSVSQIRDLTVMGETSIIDKNTSVITYFSKVL